MPVVSPPLSSEHVAYLESAASILVATSNASFVPEGVRAVGLRVHADRARISVLVPAALADRTLENLTATPRIAVTTAAAPTFSTIQLKGVARNVRDGDGADHELTDAFQPRFEAEFAWADALAREVRVNTWPCKVIEVQIETIYVEAPAP